MPPLDLSSFGAPAPEAMPDETGFTPWAPAPVRPVAAAPAPTGQGITQDQIKAVLGDGVTFTSGLRTPERNAAVGGAKNSRHLLNEAWDLVPPHGMTMAEAHAKLAASGLPHVELLNEGDHVHIGWGEPKKPTSAAPDFSHFSQEPDAPAAPKPGALDLSSFGQSDPDFYQTEQGPAKMIRPGWLEGDSFAGPASSFKTAEPVFLHGNGAAPETAKASVSPRKRTTGERFTDTWEAAQKAGPTTALGRLAAQGIGPDVYAHKLGDEVVDQAKEERDAYQARAAADPWHDAPGGIAGKGAALAATLGGELAGAFSDPINVATGAIVGGPTLMEQAAVQGAAMGGTNLITQAADHASGMRDGPIDIGEIQAAEGMGAVFPFAHAAGARALKAAGKAGKSAVEKAGDFLAGKNAAEHPVDLSSFGEPANDAGPVAPPATAAAPQAAPDPHEAPFGPTAAAEPIAAPAPVQPAQAPTLTDQALDLMRAGKTVRTETGPSLAEFIAKNGGLAPDESDAIAMDADIWHRGKPFRPKLVKEGGQSLETAAQRAHEAGYFPEIAQTGMEGADNLQPVTGGHVLEALRQELAGQPRYAGEPDPHAADLADHVQDLDELMAHIGVDPSTHTNAQIKAAIDDFMAGPDEVAQRYGMAPKSEPVRLADGTAEQGLIPGVEPVNRSAQDIAALIRQREARRGASSMPAGGLFDETAKAQTDLFGDAPRVPAKAPDLFGMAPRESKPVAAIKGDEIAPHAADLPTLRTAAKDWYEQNLRGKFVESEALGGRPVMFGVSKKSFSSSANPDKLRTFPAIPDVIAHGKLDWSTPANADSGVNVKAFHHITAPVRIGNRDLNVGVTLREDNNGHIYYNHRADEEGLDLPEGNTGPDIKSGGEPTPQNTTIKRGPGDQGGEASEPNIAQDAPDGKLASKGPMRGQPTPEAIATPEGEIVGKGAAQLEAVSGLAKRLNEALDLTTRQGRLSIKGAKGVFDVGSGVIRSKVMHELDVLAHEGGHALEFQKHPSLLAALKTYGKDLSPLAYEGAAPGSLRQEGFAEWFRWYVTNPAYAKKTLPAFYGAFESALEKDQPKMLADLRSVQGAYQDFLKAPSANAMASSVLWPAKASPMGDFIKTAKKDGMGSALRDLGDTIYTERLDRMNPINQAVKWLLKIYERNTGQRLDLRTHENAYRLSRLSVNAYTRGQMDVLNGVTPYHGSDPEGASLSEALSQAVGKKMDEHALDDFGAYLISRRMRHEWDRFADGKNDRPPDKFSKEFHEQVIADYDKANPHWADAASKVYDWTNALWTKEYEAGLIDGETYRAGMEDHPDYVPAMRDVSDKPRAGNRGQTGDAQFSGGAKKFKGSTRDFINPIHSLLRRAQTVNSLIARNDIFRALDDLAQKAGTGSGAIIERLPASEMKATNVDAMEAVQQAAKKAGLSKRDMTDLLDEVNETLGNQTQATLFRAGEINTKGEPIVFMWKNGEKIPLRLPDGKFGQQLYNVLTGMDRETLDTWAKIAAAPSQILRYGVTLDPTFAVRNTIRDQFSAAILTDVGFKPFLSSARGLADEFTHAAPSLRNRYFGGTVGGANVAALEKQGVKTSIKELQQGNTRVRKLASWRGLAELSELSETGTRNAIFRLAEQRGLTNRRGAGGNSNPLTPKQAAQEAAYLTRDYLDFDRHGSKMLFARRIITFLNAGLQGMDKAGRVLSAEGAMGRLMSGKAVSAVEQRQLRHATKAWAYISALGAVGALLAVRYHDDPEYQEISDQVRATNWVWKSGGRWHTIPKPYELAAPSNIAERLVEAKMNNDPKAYDRMMAGLGTILVPPHEAAALAIPFQIGANRDGIGRAIIPESLRGTVDPDQQYASWTSETSKQVSSAIAKVMGRDKSISPAVIDHIVGGVFGTMGDYALKAADDTAFRGSKPDVAQGLDQMPITRAFNRSFVRGSNSQNAYWDLMANQDGDYTKAVGTLKGYIKNGQDDTALAYLKKLDPAAKDFALMSVFMGEAGGAEIKGLHPLIRAQKAQGVVSSLRRDISSGEVASINGDPIQLTAEQRRDADNALAQMNMATARNALILSGVRGYANKEMLPEDSGLADLTKVDPALAATLKAHLALDNVPDEAASRNAYPTLQGQLRNLSDTQLRNLMLMERTKTDSGLLDEAARRKRPATTH